jgi:hypothetical protein
MGAYHCVPHRLYTSSRDPDLQLLTVQYRAPRKYLTLGKSRSGLIAPIVTGSTPQGGMGASCRGSTVLKLVTARLARPIHGPAANRTTVQDVIQ